MKVLSLVFLFFCVLSIAFATFDLDALIKESKEHVNDNKSDLFDISSLEASYDHNFSRELAIMSAAAYCARNQPEKLKSWTCLHARQSSLKVLDISIAHNPVSDTWAYVGSVNKNIILVAYTGSSSFQNWMTNLNFGKTPYSQCSGCEVHTGFLDAYKNSRNSIIPHVANLQKKLGSNTPVIFTGHSLGGALATLAIADAASGGFQIHDFHGIKFVIGATETFNEPLSTNIAPLMFNKQLSSSSLSSLDLLNFNQLGGTVEHVGAIRLAPGTSTFGSPRVGNAVFSQFFKSIYPHLWRVTHDRDPVPRLPMISLGFQHVNTEVYYNEKNSITVCSSTNSEDPRCSQQHIVSLSIADHLNYAAYQFDSEFC